VPLGLVGPPLPRPFRSSRPAARPGHGRLKADR
jgi:hypothetical protein